jgi:hypothetical protein
MDLLPSFGKSTYPTIIIRSLDRRKTTIYNVWNATMSTKTLPHIECVQSFFDGELQVQQPTQPPPTSHVANLTLDDGICTDDDTGNVTHLTNQQTNIENLLHALKRIWGYESFKPEQYEAIQVILHCCAQCFPQVKAVLDFFLYLPHPFTLKHLMVSHRVTY